MTTRLATNDKFRCLDIRCGVEIVVVRGSGPQPTKQAPTCGCGGPLARGWLRPTYIPSDARASRLRLR